MSTDFYHEPTVTMRQTETGWEVAIPLPIMEPFRLCACPVEGKRFFGKDRYEKHYRAEHIDPEADLAWRIKMVADAHGMPAEFLDRFVVALMPTYRAWRAGRYHGKASA